jgi:hypothetical protein
VSEQVGRDPAEEREPVHAVEGIVDVRERVLEAKGDEHDPGDHRVVQVRIGVAGERVALASRRGPRQATFRHQRHDVEVNPPHRGGESDTQDSSSDHAGAQVDVGADPEGYDRLAEREDYDQVVPLGEMGRDESPPGEAEQRRPAPVERYREYPQPSLLEAVEERRRHEQSDTDRRADREVEHRPSKGSVVTAREKEQRDVGRAHHSVCDRERERPFVECLRDAQRRDQQPRHRREEREPHRALLRIDDAREPRVCRPGPPQHREDEHALGDPLPVRIRGHQRRALRETEHEDEIEVELERLDGLLLAPLSA